MSTQTKELLTLLQEGVNRIQESSEYQTYLKTMACFPNYSANNTLLIYSQCPNATLVAGYSTWKNRFKRHVRKGEKAIRIFAPYTYEVRESDSETSTRTGFRAAYVFDISQTEGESLPMPVLPAELESEVSRYEKILEALELVSRYPVSFQELPEGINGTCCYWDELIKIRKQMPQLQTIKTLIHEMAHAWLHNPYDLEEGTEFERYVLASHGLREMEAESTAFVVCMHLGLDCSEYSFPYIAGWKRKEKFFEKSLDRIQKTSEKMIEKIDRNLGLCDCSAWPFGCLPDPSAWSNVNLTAGLRS